MKLNNENRMKRIKALLTLASLFALGQEAWAQEHPQIEGLTYTNGYYEIPDAAALNALAAYVNDGNDCEGLTFKVTADIAFGASDQFTPVGMGDESYEGTPFSGTFDGGNFTISGAKYEDVEGIGIALFGYIHHPAVIKNVKLNDCSFKGNYEVGGIVGASAGSSDKGDYGIYNCSVGSGVAVTAVSATIEGEEVPGTNVGGIIGYCYCLTVSDCYSEAVVNGDEYVGSIAGYLLGSNYAEGVIKDCYFANVGETPVGGRGQDDGFVSDATDGILKITLLSDDSEASVKNAQRLANYDDLKADVTVDGMTLAKDQWNALSLPLGISSFPGTVLEGADVRRLDGSSYEKRTLTLSFSTESAQQISSSVCYIVKPGSDAQNPEFKDAQVSKVSPQTTTSTHVNLEGLYSPKSFEAGERSILYLGADNRLYYPRKAKTARAFSAYFALQNGITAGGRSGDIDADGSVNISDVTALVNIILGDNESHQQNADVNDDAHVDISDVTELVNIILGNADNTMRTLTTDPSIGISYGFGGK